MKSLLTSIAVSLALFGCTDARRHEDDFPVVKTEAAMKSCYNRCDSVWLSCKVDNSMSRAQCM